VKSAERSGSSIAPVALAKCRSTGTPASAVSYSGEMMVMRSDRPAMGECLPPWQTLALVRGAIVEAAGGGTRDAPSAGHSWLNRYCPDVLRLRRRTRLLLVHRRSHRRRGSARTCPPRREPATHAAPLICHSSGTWQGPSARVHSSDSCSPTDAFTGAISYPMDLIRKLSRPMRQVSIKRSVSAPPGVR
jgi:hypothetical protein